MTNTIILEPILYHLRFYDSPVDNEEVLGPYKSIATVSKCGTVAFISGLKGTITKDEYKNMFVKIAETGVERVIWETHKNGKVVSKDFLIKDILK